MQLGSIFFVADTLKHNNRVFLHDHAGVLEPRLERNLEVHLGQEWVDTIFFLDDLVIDLLVLELFGAFIETVKSFNVDLELGS